MQYHYSAAKRTLHVLVNVRLNLGDVLEEQGNDVFRELFDGGLKALCELAHGEECDVSHQRYRIVKTFVHLLQPAL